MRAPIMAVLLYLLAGTAYADETIKFGIAAHVDSLLPVIGADADRNWYKQEGLKIDFKMIRWRDLPEAIATGEVDVAISDLAVVVGNHEKHPDLVYWYGLATMDNAYALMVRPNGPFKTVEQFSGQLHDRNAALQAATLQLQDKTVIAPSNSEMEQALSIVARNAGMNFTHDNSSDIHIMDMRPDDGLKAFLADQGDAYMAPLVQRMLAEKAGMIEMLSGPDLQADPIVGMVTTRTYAETHKDELLKLLHVWFRTVNYVQENAHAVGMRIAAEMVRGGTSGFTATDFENSWQKFEHFPLSPEEADSDILNADSPNYWKMRQKECSQYFCSVAETLPEPVEDDSYFLMPQVQQEYLGKYTGDQKR